MTHLFLRRFGVSAVTVQCCKQKVYKNDQKETNQSEQALQIIMS
jgi:hypothetical protein